MKKGSKITEEHRLKLAKAKFGRPSNAKGVKWSKESRENFKLRRHIFTPDEKRRAIETTIKNGAWNKGIKRPEMTGVKNPNWKGGYERRKFNIHKRRVLKMNAIGSHTNGDWDKMKSFYGYMCLCCKRCEPEVELTRDHIVPLSKGGTNNIENIQPLCRSCNSRKNTKTISYIESIQININHA